MVSVRHVLTLIVFGVYTTRSEPELGTGASGKERAWAASNENLACTAKTD